MSWLICGSTRVVVPKAPKIFFVPSDSEHTNLSELFTKEQDKSNDLETIYAEYAVVDSRFTRLELRVADLEARFKPLQNLETLEQLEVEVPQEVPQEKPTVEVTDTETTQVTQIEEVTEVKVEEVKVEEVKEDVKEEVKEEVKVESEPMLEISELPSVVLPELVLDTKEVLATFFRTIHQEINYIEKNMNVPLPMALIEQLKRLSHDAKIPLPRSPKLEVPQLR